LVRKRVQKKGALFSLKEKGKGAPFARRQKREMSQGELRDCKDFYLFTNDGS